MDASPTMNIYELQQGVVTACWTVTAQAERDVYKKTRLQVLVGSSADDGRCNEVYFLAPVLNFYEVLDPTSSPSEM